MFHLWIYYLVGIQMSLLYLSEVEIIFTTSHIWRVQSLKGNHNFMNSPYIYIHSYIKKKNCSEENLKWKYSIKAHLAQISPHWVNVHTNALKWTFQKGKNWLNSSTLTCSALHHIWHTGWFIEPLKSFQMYNWLCVLSLKKKKTVHTVSHNPAVSHCWLRYF